MRRRKKCRYCRKLFEPHPQTYRQQKTCSKKACQNRRKRQAIKRWRLQHPFDEENRRKTREHWRQKHKCYWRKWRASHPGYVRKNREKQKERNARRRAKIAKRNAWEQVQREKTAQIRMFREIAKRNAWIREYTEKTVQIVLLKIIAKRNGMAKGEFAMGQ